MATTTDLVCPKGQGRMRSYERSGVTVDQCADCRGIFLDRGELERLVDAEQGWQRGNPAPSERDDERGRQQSIPNPFKDRDDDDRRYREGSKKRRKKSFFDELFD
jgi:Zn-finger nucleic acid-binding protein